MKSGKNIGDPIALIDVFQESIHNYDFCFKMGFIDFTKWFEGSYQSIPNIKSCHLIQFTSEGILTKSDDLNEHFSQWREDPTVEPFKCFSKESLTFPPPIMVTPKLSTKVNMNFVPPSSTSFYESLVNGGCGSSQPDICEPDLDVEFFVHEEIDMTLPDQTLQNTDKTVIETDAQITGFGELVWNSNDSSWELETFYEGHDDFVYLSKFEFLVDDDGTMNQSFLKWSKSHPTLFNKFKNKVKPKEKVQKSPNTDKGLGKILGNGRGFRNSK